MAYDQVHGLLPNNQLLVPLHDASPESRILNPESYSAFPLQLFLNQLLVIKVRVVAVEGQQCS